ncbi:MAG: 30S ribosomal protein S16 [Bacteroidales bacterium]|nr:30S ribosomal protein S16 [Bacteroidales bacterium]
MPVKIRLARQGKKGYAHYSIVVADSRAPRDGRFIEKIGTYNPNTNPAQIDIKFDRALYWIQTGAQPTDTCRTLLSQKGVLLKDHLLRGVTKKALTEQQAEAKFEEWLKNKENKINAAKESNESKKKSEVAKRLEAETKVKEAKLAEINKKKAEAEAAAKAAEAEKAAETAEAPADEPKAE